MLEDNFFRVGKYTQEEFGGAEQGGSIGWGSIRFKKVGTRLEYDSLFSLHAGQATWILISLLAALNLAAIMMLVGLPRLVTGRTHLAIRILLGITLLALVSEMLNEGLARFEALGLIGHDWLLFVIAGGLLAAHRLERGWLQRAWWRRWGSPLLVLTLGAIALGGSFWRFHVHGLEVHQEWLPEDGPVVPRLVSIPNAVAVTDSGHELPLFQFDVPTDGVLTDAETLGGDIGDKVILVEGSESTANCHGWVFTDGHYMIPSQWVDTILKDNGYELVEEPQVDDLIIYRNAGGVPVHTGVVKATGKEHFVLIESKWGGMPTYLHLPSDQVYSSQFSYYRSRRAGHLVHIAARQSAAGVELPNREPMHLSAE